MADRAPARAAERHRADHPGHRPELPLPGRRDRCGRVHLQLPRHRPGTRLRGRRQRHPGDPAHRRHTRGVLRVHEYRHRRYRRAGHATAENREVAMAVVTPGRFPAEQVPGPARAARRGHLPEWLSSLWAAVRTTRGGIGLALVSLIVALAVVGPWGAPSPPNGLPTLLFTVVGGPFLLGSDAFGNHVLCRILTGSWLLLLLTT